MEKEFIENIKTRLKKSNKFILYFSVSDIERLLNIIEGLESSNANVCKSKYTKELEEQHRQDCNIINIYVGGNNDDKK